LVEYESLGDRCIGPGQEKRGGRLYREGETDRKG
jgi:hypothetical protein